MVYTSIKGIDEYVTHLINDVEERNGSYLIFTHEGDL